MKTISIPQVFQTDSVIIDDTFCNTIKRARNKFDHKGVFGHAMLIAGCEEMFGAAILSAKSCMRSGVGLLTVDIPKACNTAMNIALPEAMLNSFEISVAKCNAVGIGPGIGISDNALAKLVAVIEAFEKNRILDKKLVIDADALNILSVHKDLMRRLPFEAILTPHPKEFERLFGCFINDKERCEKQLQASKDFSVIIVYKTANTLITMPDGKIFVNSTGNPGMATAGSGDVLTGLITGLLARGYSPCEAAALGVFTHGRAGDLAAAQKGEESMIASDIIDNIRL